MSERPEGTTHHTQFSTVFPAYHPKAGQPTHFIEKIWSGLLNIDHHWYQQFLPGHDQEDMTQGLELRNKVLRFTPKYHTIREGQRFQVGDSIIPWHWSGKPYRSKWVRPFDNGNLAIPIERVWNFEFASGAYYLNDRMFDGEVESHHEILDLIATNDGLSRQDFLDWFKYPKPSGKMQIVCWNADIRYLDSDPKPKEMPAPNPSRKITRLP